MPSPIPIEPRHLLLLVIFGSAVCWAAAGIGRRDWTLLLGIQIVLALTVQIIAEVMSRSGNTHALYNGYAIVEFLLLLGMARAFLETARERSMSTFALLAFTGMFVAELWYYGSIHRLATMAVIGGGFMLVALYGYVMVRLVDRASRPLFRTPAFWVFTGMVVYLAASAPILGLIHYLLERDKDLAKSLFLFTQFIAMVRYAAIGVGLCLLTPGDDRW